MWKTLFCCWIGIASVALRAPSAQAQIPDNPQPQTVCLGPNSCGWHQYTILPPDPPTFWTFAPNRPFRSTLRSPWFLIPEVVGDGLAVWDWKRSKCGPNAKTGNNPCSGFWGERGIAMIAVPAFQWVIDSKVSRPVGLVPVGILIGKSVYSLATGRYQ
jgi:hypothetical protein